MSNCRNTYEDIIKVEFFSDSDDVISFKKPFVVYEPLITVSDNTADNADCTIKKSADFVALIYEMSGTLTVDSSTDIAGTKFKVTLEYTMEWIGNEEDNEEYKRQLLCLRQNNYHLRVTYFGGAQQIIRSDKSSWMFSYKESKGKPNVTISLENISGAQRII